MCLTDSPEVEAERATVHTGIGLEAQLVCIVHAEPPPQVSTNMSSIKDSSCLFDRGVDTSAPKRALGASYRLNI